MQTTLGELVETMIRPTGKILDDVLAVTTDHPTDPTVITVKFKDGTEATIDIQRQVH